MRNQSRGRASLDYVNRPAESDQHHPAAESVSAVDTIDLKSPKSGANANMNNNDSHAKPTGFLRRLSDTLSSKSGSKTHLRRPSQQDFGEERSPLLNHDIPFFTTGSYCDKHSIDPKNSAFQGEQENTELEDGKQQSNSSSCSRSSADSFGSVTATVDPEYSKKVAKINPENSEYREDSPRMFQRRQTQSQHPQKPVIPRTSSWTRLGTGSSSKDDDRSASTKFTRSGSNLPLVHPGIRISDAETRSPYEGGNFRSLCANGQRKRDIFKAVAGENVEKTSFITRLEFFDILADIETVLKSQLGTEYVRCKNVFKFEANVEQSILLGEIKVIEQLGECRVEFRKSPLDKKTGYWAFVEYFREFERELNALIPGTVPLRPTVRELYYLQKEQEHQEHSMRCGETENVSQGCGEPSVDQEFDVPYIDLRELEQELDPGMRSRIPSPPGIPPYASAYK